MQLAFPVPCSTGLPFPRSQLQEPALPAAPLPQGRLSSRGSTRQRHLRLPSTHQPTIHCPLPVRVISHGPWPGNSSPWQGCGAGWEHRVGCPGWHWDGGASWAQNPGPHLHFSLLWAPGKVSPETSSWLALKCPVLAE